ncbi:hypothetical protein LZ32DRAFT_301766 [Colletotrichum eremochloae]|nr:hypothetical protein LZ32DRAFT_301766 [Colletotrichum eremochloae]
MKEARAWGIQGNVLLLRLSFQGNVGEEFFVLVFPLLFLSLLFFFFFFSSFLYFFTRLGIEEERSYLSRKSFSLIQNRVIRILKSVENHTRVRWEKKGGGTREGVEERHGYGLLCVCVFSSCHQSYYYRRYQSVR